MYSSWTTISCRFAAQAFVAAACALDDDPAYAQAAARSQFLPLAPRWSVELSAPPAGPPIIAGEIIVVPLHEAGVTAFKASDHSIAWNAEMPIDPAVSADEGRVYIVSREAMRALDLKTGAEVWRTEIGQLTAPPLVHSGWVVVATVGKLAALRASDGSAVWRQEIGTIESPPAIDGDLLVVSLLEGSLLALNLQNGETRWETPLGGAPGEPLVLGGRVYAGGRDKRFYALDAEDGEGKWVRRVGAAPRGRPAIDDDHVYLVALDNVLRAYNRGDGALKWWKTLSYRPAAGPLAIGTALIVPGAVSSVPVFGTDGADLTKLPLPATLAGVSNVTRGPNNFPTFSIVTGDLQHAWTLWLLDTSLAPPDIPLADFTALPGVAIAIVLPQ